MRHFAFQIPIDDGARDKIGCGMRSHQQPYPPGDGQGNRVASRGSRLILSTLLAADFGLEKMPILSSVWTVDRGVGRYLRPSEKQLPLPARHLLHLIN